MATAIGLVSGILLLVAILQSDTPNPGSNSQTFRIQVGLDGTSNGEDDSELTEAGGTIENILVYDNNGVLVSNEDDTNSIDIAQGISDEITVELRDAYQGVTANFIAGDDAICIATIVTTLVDGSSFGFTGDWSSICDGVAGYPSGVDMESVDGERVTPRCVWIDANGDVGDATTIAMHFPSVAGYTDEADVVNRCGRGAGFRAYNADGDQIASPGSSLKKRSVQAGDPHLGRRDDRLVISDSSAPSHQASNVCDDPYNYGPDFASLYEWTYCNMSSREVLPLCGSDTDNGGECFDLDEARGHGPAKRSMLGRLEHRALGARQTKTPTKIIDWTRK